MVEVRETRISVSGVRSLVWHGDVLVDWVAGGRQFTLDGKIQDSRIDCGYLFDASVTSPSGEFSAIYTRLGTKGLILRRGEVLREINRSYHHADLYEFPVALIRLEDGREMIVHCPSAYNQLEIEDLATGQSLAGPNGRTPADCFHSRLSGSPDGKYLASAGGCGTRWMSCGSTILPMRSPTPVISMVKGLDIDAWADDGISAAFLAMGELAVDLVGLERDEEEPDPWTAELRLFDPSLPATPKMIRRPERLGTMMAIGDHHMLSLYEHPKLIDLRTGDITRRWLGIDSGVQKSSIVAQDHPTPPIALDHAGQRCAIANTDGIDVLEFQPG
ncbi:hypothetical protein SLT36_23660 [Aminobacter sp. BA135]|uniref:hypothetical protein n=1 Tax=Aminobacter sp. BA135 TaxID=537596 RepID=UPI003D7B0E96